MDPPIPSSRFSSVTKASGYVSDKWDSTPGTSSNSSPATTSELVVDSLHLASCQMTTQSS